jgi:hypothetical protein
MFPTWPAKSELAAGSSTGPKKAASPKPPSGKCFSRVTHQGKFKTL